MRNNLGEKIRPNIVAYLFNNAFGRVATVEKATKGFEVTGIFPVNPDVFTAEDFAPAENLNPTNSNEAIPKNGQVEENRTEEMEEEIRQQRIDADTNEIEKRQNKSFREIIPIPGCSGTNNEQEKRGGKKQHSQIFTSTPMKEILEEKKNAKEKKLQKGNRDLEQQKAKRVKKQVFGNSDEIRVLGNKHTNIAMQQKPELRKKIKVNYHDCEEEENNSDTEVTEDICIICGEFGKIRELWLRCVRCYGWAHNDCTNGEKKKTYLCDFCQ